MVRSHAMSETIWTIKLLKVKSGYRVVLTGDDPFIGIYGMKATADGRTPHIAYQSACAKLVVKPWLESKP